MPVTVRHPTTDMPGIQFGIPSAMSTHGSNPSSRRGECEGCVRKKREGHRSAREPKYCPRHQCKHTDTSGVLCTARKKAADAQCPMHTRCEVRGCNDPRNVDIRGIAIDYCINHNCRVVDCDEGKAHDPTRGVYDDLCATHLSSICQNLACDEWKHENGNFCLQHTCAIEKCNKKNLHDGGRPFCTEHNQCNIQGCQKPRCEFESQFEILCRDHYVPPCTLQSCSKEACPSTRYCNLHSCRYTDRKRCEKEARPGRGKPFCVDHKCLDHDCQNLRSFSEVDGFLTMNPFCPNHECKQRDCVKHNVPDKPFCNSHCCTNQSCIRARDDDRRFGTLCYEHHQEQITNRAVDERLAEIRLDEERNARSQAARAEDEARRQGAQPRRREGYREREDRERREQADNTTRRPGPRASARSPPRSPYEQEGLRPGRGKPYSAGSDEGYRSNRSSGGSFHAEDGW